VVAVFGNGPWTGGNPGIGAEGGIDAERGNGAGIGTAGIGNDVGDTCCPPVVGLAFVCAVFGLSTTGVAGVVLPPSIDRISACAMSALEAAGRYNAFALTVCGSSVLGCATPGSPYALPESTAPSSTLIRLRNPFALSAALAEAVEREGDTSRPALRVGSLRFGAAAASAFTLQINAVRCPTRQNQ
jgi:hypothetical protein